MKNREGNRLYISLGSNIAPEENISESIRLLKEYVEVKAVSSVWETPPIGMTGNYFLNAAAKLETSLSQAEVKEDVLRRIESRMGRTWAENKFSPRPIDLDIVIFNDRIIDPALWELAHVVIPLAELIPHWLNPDNQKTLVEYSQNMLATAVGIKKVYIKIPK